MRKRTSLFVILLSALLMVSMMSAMAFAKDKKEAPEKEKAERHALKTESTSAQQKDFSIKDIIYYPVWVGGVQVDETNKGNVLPGGDNDGKVSYEPSSDGKSGTLTLNGATITKTEEYRAIYSHGIDLTIKLEGVNKIGDLETPTGIYAEGNYEEYKYTDGGSLTIVGDGSMNVSGNIAVYADGKISVTAKELTAESSFWESISSGYDDVEITNAKVIASSDHDNAIQGINIALNNAYVEATSNELQDTISAKGIWENHEEYVSDGDVTINGGTVKATANGGGKGTDAIYGAGNVTITGADTNVTAVTNCGAETNSCTGICADYGNVEIKGGTVTATVSGSKFEDCDAIYADEDISITGGDVTATVTGGMYDCDAICADDGKVTISGAGTKVTATTDDSMGISADGEIKISDARVNALSGNGVAILGYSLEVEGSSAYVEAETKTLNMETNMLGISKETDPIAIVTFSGITINDPLSIIRPEKGSIGKYYEGEITTILQGDKPASHVIIEAPKHDITVEETPGGKVKVEPEKAAEGEEVKVIATPDEGYEVEKIVVLDADGKETDITARGSFTMGKTNVKVRVTFRKKAAPAAKPVAAVKGIAKGQTSLKFTWKKVKGAAKYEIWMSRCNTSKKKYSVKKVKTLGASKTTWTKKNLRKNTGYKFRVVAKDASGKVICKSVICHSYTGNVWSKYTNVKSLKVSKSSYTLKKGGKAKIKAKQTKVRPDKKLCHHAKMLRYKSNNPSVAKVDKSGKITAVGTGECKIYVQTVNGIWKTVKVSVN